MNNLNDFSDSVRSPEYQAILIVDYDDGRMFPLTEDIPKCLLPVGNRKLLSYQLDMLAKSGVAEVFIVAPKEYEVKLSHFLGEYVRNTMNIDLVAIEDMYGSADCLRAVRDRIRGDFFCLHSDFISQYCLGDMATMHRLSTSDLTMMLTTNSNEVKRDEVDEEFIGICDDGRVMMKTPALEIDETIDLSKPLLHHAPTFSLRQDLMDLGIYLMSHWVLEFLMSNHKITSIRTDLVPYLINRQHQPVEYLMDHMPALQHRNRPLRAIEPWIMNSDPAIPGSRKWSEGNGCVEDKGQAVLDVWFSEDSEAPSRLHADSPVPPSSAAAISVCRTKTAAAAGPAATAGKFPGGGDLLRCYALVYDPPARTEVAGAVSNVTILTRVLNIANYLNLNKDLVLHKNTIRTPWARLQHMLKKEMSVIGDGTSDVVAEKTITVKQCCIGSNVKIGAMAKLNNCVIMDNVTIGDNCTVQNSIICERGIVEGMCKLNDCNVGAGCKVATGSKVKGESFTASNQH